MYCSSSGCLHELAGLGPEIWCWFGRRWTLIEAWPSVLWAWKAKRSLTLTLGMVIELVLQWCVCLIICVRFCYFGEINGFSIRFSQFILPLECNDMSVERIVVSFLKLMFWFVAQCLTFSFLLIGAKGACMDSGG